MPWWELKYQMSAIIYIQYALSVSICVYFYLTVCYFWSLCFYALLTYTVQFTQPSRLLEEHWVSCLEYHCRCPASGQKPLLTFATTKRCNRKGHALFVCLFSHGVGQPSDSNFENTTHLRLILTNLISEIIAYELNWNTQWDHSHAIHSDIQKVF